MENQIFCERKSVIIVNGFLCDNLANKGIGMIKERISLSGDLKDKVKQLMQYAGWYEGRKVDISIAEEYYSERGIEMMKTTKRFYQKYFGLCCEWFFFQKRNETSSRL